MLASKNEVTFSVAGYDPKRALVIDPTLVYTYMAGGQGIAVDSYGNAYVTGYTYSTDFPTVNPLQPSPGGEYDAFVAKLNPTGSALVYSTYLGGSSDDFGFGIAVDVAGNAYVTGWTSSSDFPTANALQPQNPNTCSPFVAKLNPAGSALVYSTYLGGGSAFGCIDYGEGIAADAAGNAYVTGITDSTDFPTANPLQPVFGGGEDAFVTKLNPTGSALVYSTYLGGSGDDAGEGIAVDSAGNAYVAGYTMSTDFPTANPLQPNIGGIEDAFVAKLNPAGSALIYSTYLGGSGHDWGRAVAADSVGNAYVTGNTESTDFPTANAFQANCHSCTPWVYPPGQGGPGGLMDNAFVAKLNPTGSALVYSTYLGGSGNDAGNAIAADSAGNAYVTGWTGSTDFPTANPLQASCDNCSPNNVPGPFVASLNPTGSVLVYSTYLGSGGDGIAVDAAGNAYVTGGIAFVAKISPSGGAYSAGFSPTTLTFGSQNVGTTSASQTVTVTNTGTANLSISKVMIAGANASDFAKSPDTCTGATVTPNGSCTVGVTFTPTATGSRSASLSFADDGPDTPQTVGLTGTGAAPVAGVSPPSLTFGNQNLGTTSGSQPVTLSNTGTAALTVTSIAISANFSATNNCGASLAASGSCTINVTFSPTGAGSLNGTLTITDDSNGVTGSTQTVGLSGTGMGPVASLSSYSVGFSPQLLGSSGAAQPVTVTNTGNTSLTIFGIATSANFGETNNCGTSVAASDSCTVNVTFSPTATGALTGTLTITDNSNGATGNAQTVTLTGTGMAPLVTLSAPGLNFGSQPISTTSAAQAETVTNAGTANLMISAINIGGTNAGDFTKGVDACTGATVTPNGTCTVSLTFTPSAVGSRSASMSFTDNASNSPQTATLTGTGVGPLVGLSATGLSFASQILNTTSAAQVETVTNAGTANLTISSVIMGGTNASDFAKSADTCTGATVSPNGTCTVSVTFTPSAAGSRSASLNFSDNATNSPQMVALSGTAILGPLLTVSPASLTFAAQYVGTTGLPQNVTLQNTGDQNITISNVQASSSFGATNGCTSSLAPQVSCTIGVFFDPTASGNINGTLTITDNAPGSPHTVALSGTGQDFNFAPASGSSTSAALAAGQAATYTLSMAGQGGLSGTVTLSCTGAPSEATCTVPGSVTVGSSATNVTVTVATTAASVSAPRSRPLPPVPPVMPGLRGLLMLALVLTMMSWFMGRRNQPSVSRWRSTMVPLASGLLLALALAGCGGGGGGSSGGPPPNPGTPAGTYTLTVTGTTGSGSATLSHSVTLTLKVS